jgi:predicted patatin/cPLA2 family phospholipase
MEEVEFISKSKIEHEGDPKKVFLDIKNFRDKRVLGHEPNTGPLLMVLHGSIRGAYGGGGVEALDDLGFRFGFKTAVGVSTGSPTIAYFLSGQASVGKTIYSEDCLNPNFMNLKRGTEGGSVLDMTWLMNEVVNKGRKALNLREFFRNPTQTFFAVTDYVSGESYLLNPKVQKENSVNDILQASCSVPELYVDLVYLNINGKKTRVIDGAVGNNFPVKAILEKVQPTSILVFTNRPKSIPETFFSKILNTYFAFINNPDNKRSGVEKDLLNQNDNFQENLYELKYSGIPYLLVWSDDSISSLEKDKEKIEKASQNFYNYILNLAKKSLKI